MWMFQYRMWAREVDEGRVPEGFQILMEEMGAIKQES